MKHKKRQRFVDKSPVQLPAAISGYEKESREAEAKLADTRKAAKKKPAKHS